MLQHVAQFGVFRLMAANVEPHILKCRSCRKGLYAPPAHMIKLTKTQEITPYKWVHPDEEREATPARAGFCHEVRLSRFGHSEGDVPWVW